jgi:peptide chain release factor 2
MNELLVKIAELQKNIAALKTSLKLPEKKQRILELEEEMAGEHFWQDQSRAQKLSQEHSALNVFYEFWDTLQTETKELTEILKQNTDESPQTVSYLQQQLEQLQTRYEKNRFMALLSKKYDDHSAIFSIHAGAGGTDAQDWAEMLLRMYLRFCEKKEFKTEIVDISRGGEAGIKSVTVEVTGPFAYGLIKAEAGVHRLVRLSPFNPAHTRETSFALLEVLPMLEEKETAGLDPKDVKIEVTTSSGHGGQSVNTTYSAVRMTHIPTGLKVSIQNERSQHQNRELAMKILTAKVASLEEEKLAKEKKELRGEFKSAEWGSQIRSYVLHPYKMIKDHRTNLETSDPESVLDGELEPFIEKYLESTIK